MREAEIKCLKELYSALERAVPDPFYNNDYIMDGEDYSEALAILRTLIAMLGGELE